MKEHLVRPANHPTTMGAGAIILDRPRGDNEERTTFFVPGTQPAAGEQTGAFGSCCVLDKESAVPIGVVCMLARGTAFYLLFDPLDPTTKKRLSKSCGDGELAILTSLGDGPEWGVAIPVDAECTTAPGRRGIKHRPHDFIQKAMNLLCTLPLQFQADIPELEEVADQRAFWMRPEEVL